MQQERSYRTALAFLTASVVPALGFAVLYPLSGELDWRSGLGTFAVTYYFSAVATGFLGLPAFLLLRKFDLVAWWSALCGGAIAGAIAQFVIAWGSPSNIESLLSFATLGAASGLAFWLVWRRWSPAATHGGKNAA